MEVHKGTTPISTKDQLPEKDIFVLGRCVMTNWGAKDQEGCQWKVVSLRDDTIQGNNETLYSWDSFGASTFFGQDIDYWVPLPRVSEFPFLGEFFDYRDQVRRKESEDFAAIFGPELQRLLNEDEK